jgi:uncharacterized protein YdeI (YjbR/CyaY-like superfamily)
MMLVNKQMQKGGQVQPGMEARFRMEPDLEKREVKMPPELERVLRPSKRLQKFYQSMTPYMRNFIVSSVAKGKQPETRIRRADQIAELLLETMEAEIELPPLLRQAFARNPEVAGVWRLMTPSQRRSQLLSIFHYRTHDGRLRRIEKMTAELMGKKSATDYAD